jgi:hypothetical protein
MKKINIFKIVLSISLNIFNLGISNPSWAMGNKSGKAKTKTYIELQDFGRSQDKAKQSITPQNSILSISNERNKQNYNNTQSELPSKLLRVLENLDSIFDIDLNETNNKLPTIQMFDIPPRELFNAQDNNQESVTAPMLEVQSNLTEINNSSDSDNLPIPNIGPIEPKDNIFDEETRLQDNQAITQQINLDEINNSSDTDAINSYTAKNVELSINEITDDSNEDEDYSLKNSIENPENKNRTQINLHNQTIEFLGCGPEDLSEYLHGIKSQKPKDPYDEDLHHLFAEETSLQDNQSITQQINIDEINNSLDSDTITINTDTPEQIDDEDLHHLFAEETSLQDNQSITQQINLDEINNSSDSDTITINTDTTEQIDHEDSNPEPIQSRDYQFDLPVQESIIAKEDHILNKSKEDHDRYNYIYTNKEIKNSLDVVYSNIDLYNSLNCNAAGNEISETNNNLLLKILFGNGEYKNTTKNLSNYKSNNYGGIIGINTSVSDRSKIGAAFSLIYNDINHNNQDYINNTIFVGSLYTNIFFKNNIILDMSVNFVKADTKNQKNKPYTQEFFTGRILIGYEIYKENVSIIPSIEARVNDIKIKDIDPIEAILNLKVGKEFSKNGFSVTSFIIGSIGKSIDISDADDVIFSEHNKTSSIKKNIGAGIAIKSGRFETEISINKVFMEEYEGMKGCVKLQINL